MSTRTLLVVEVELDEGVRPSTRLRRLDRVARSLGEAADGLRIVRSVESVRILEPSDGAEVVRCDGTQFTTRPGVALELGRVG